MNKRTVLGVLLFVAISCPITFGYSSNSAEIGHELQENKQKKQSIYYIVDGKHMSAKEVDKIDPATVDKMEFIKEAEKIRKYTEEDVDMVVLITMKKSKGNDTTSVATENDE